MDEYLALRKAFEEKRRQAWEIARWEQFNQISISPYIKRSDKPRRVIDLVRFPWDEDAQGEQNVYRLTDEELSKLNKIMS